MGCLAEESRVPWGELSLVKRHADGLLGFESVVELTLEETVETSGLKDMTMTTTLGPELNRLEPTHIVGVVEHVTNNSIALRNSDGETSKYASLEDDLVGVAGLQSTGSSEGVERESLLVRAQDMCREHEDGSRGEDHTAVERCKIELLIVGEETLDEGLISARDDLGVDGGSREASEADLHVHGILTLDGHGVLIMSLDERVHDSHLALVAVEAPQQRESAASHHHLSGFGSNVGNGDNDGGGTLAVDGATAKSHLVIEILICRLAGVLGVAHGHLEVGELKDLGVFRGEILVMVPCAVLEGLHTAITSEASASRDAGIEIHFILVADLGTLHASLLLRETILTLGAVLEQATNLLLIGQVCEARDHLLVGLAAVTQRAHRETREIRQIREVGHVLIEAFLYAHLLAKRLLLLLGGKIIHLALVHASHIHIVVVSGRSSLLLFADIEALPHALDDAVVVETLGLSNGLLVEDGGVLRHHGRARRQRGHRLDERKVLIAPIVESCVVSCACEGLDDDIAVLVAGEHIGSLLELGVHGHSLLQLFIGDDRLFVSEGVDRQEILHGLVLFGNSREESGLGELFTLLEVGNRGIFAVALDHENLVVAEAGDVHELVGGKGFITTEETCHTQSAKSGVI